MLYSTSPESKPCVLNWHQKDAELPVTQLASGTSWGFLSFTSFEADANQAHVTRVFNQPLPFVKVHCKRPRPYTHKENNVVTLELAAITPGVVKAWTYVNTRPDFSTRAGLQITVFQNALKCNLVCAMVSDVPAR